MTAICNKNNVGKELKFFAVSSMVYKVEKLEAKGKRSEPNI